METGMWCPGVGAGQFKQEPLFEEVWMVFEMQTGASVQRRCRKLPEKRKERPLAFA